MIPIVTETAYTSMTSLHNNLAGDKTHILILFFLYVLQGIPTGLLKAIPLILSNRNVPYKDHAVFSIAAYPYSMKLLWAPLVDSLYSSQFGRRKSWLVPAQYLIGKIYCSEQSNKLVKFRDYYAGFFSVHVRIAWRI